MKIVEIGVDGKRFTECRITNFEGNEEVRKKREHCDSTRIKEIE
jgi:hypothetical protein